MLDTRRHHRLPPGPRVPAFLQVAMYGPRPLALFDQCHRRYGDAFTLRLLGGQPTVMFSAPDAVRTVLELPASDFTVNGDLLVPILGSRSVVVMDGEVHRRERRLLLRAFHAESFARHEQTMVETTARHLASWPRGEVIAMLPKMQALTLEVMLRVAFGVSDAAQVSQVLPPLAEFLGFADSYRTLLSIATQGRFLRGTFADFERRRTRVLDVLTDLIEERRREPDLESRVDVLSMLLRVRDVDGDGFGDRELRDELMTLLLAGHDTTATALGWAFDLLAHNPNQARLLACDVDAGNDTYLDACVKEVLRIRPVIPETGRRLAVDREIGGWRLPAGTLVGANVYLLHRRPQEYTEPDAFRPERFIEGTPTLHAWHPFGGGVRRCIGVAFANLELRTVLRAVATNLRIEAVRLPEQARRRAVTLVPAHGAPVRLVDRE
jgi:cytochrome P450